MSTFQINEDVSIVGNLCQYNNLYNWYMNNYSDGKYANQGGKFISWSDEWKSDDKVHPIACFDQEFDMIIFEECPFIWAADQVEKIWF